MKATIEIDGHRYEATLYGRFDEHHPTRRIPCKQANCAGCNSVHRRFWGKPRIRLTGVVQSGGWQEPG